MFNRVAHKTNYTVVDNGFLRNRGLSLKARGLLATVLSEPDAWQFSVQGFAAILPDGRTAISGALRELEEHGYLVRHDQVRGEDGKLGPAVYDVYEDPATNPRWKDGSFDESTEVATAARNLTTALNCGDMESAQAATVGGFSVDGERAQLSNDLLSNDLSSTAVNGESFMSSDGEAGASAIVISSPGYQGNPGHHTNPGFIDSAARVLERGNDVMGLKVDLGDRDAENLFKALEGGMGADDCIKAIEFCAATWSPEAREHLCFRTVFKPDKVGSYAADWLPKHEAVVQERIDKRPLSPEEVPESVKCPRCGDTVSDRAPNGLFVCGVCNLALRPRPG